MFIDLILELNLMLHESPVKSTRLQRLLGYATAILDGVEFKPNDVFLIISNSGRNPGPVEAAADSKGSPYDELTKCLEIASRIMKGDKVPRADIQFLAEKQPELYSSAMMMKQNN